VAPITGLLATARNACRKCAKLGAFICVCGGIAVAPMKNIDLPSPHAFFQLATAASTAATSTYTTMVGSPPILTVANEVTDEEYSALMVKQTPDYGDRDDRPVDATTFMAPLLRRT
jgi:hypothetical protein